MVSHKINLIVSLVIVFILILLAVFLSLRISVDEFRKSFPEIIPSGIISFLLIFGFLELIRYSRVKKNLIVVAIVLGIMMTYFAFQYSVELSSDCPPDPDGILAICPIYSEIGWPLKLTDTSKTYWWLVILIDLTFWVLVSWGFLKLIIIIKHKAKGVRNLFSNKILKKFGLETIERKQGRPKKGS